MNATIRRCAFLICIAAHSPIASTPAATTTPVLRISGIQAARGQLLIGIHRSSASFPGDWDRAERFLKVPIKKRGDQIVEIPKLALGTCAIIVVHDLDGDSRMTKNLIGFPQEPFGTSNNPTFYGPPRFRAAAFTLKPGEQIAVRLVRL